MENTESNSKIWTPAFLILNILLLLFFTNISLFYLYPLALKHMAFKDASIGLIMGIFSVSTVISRPFMGKLIIRKNEYFVISLSMLITIIASLGYLIVDRSTAAIYCVRILHGIGFSAFISSSFSLVAVELPAHKQAQAYGIVGASLMAAIAVIPPVGETLIQKYGFTMLYIAASAAIALAWIVTKFLPKYIHSRPKALKIKHVRYIDLLKSSSFVFLLISTLIFAHCQSTMLNFLALLAKEQGCHSGKFFFSTFFVAILVLLGMGKTIDRYGKILFLKLSYPFFSAGLLLIPLLIKQSLFFIPACLVGLAMGCLFPVHNALAAAHGSNLEKPAVMSVFTSVYDTGFITGALLSGLAAQFMGIERLFTLTGLLAAVGFIFVLFAPISEHDSSPSALRNTHT